MESSEPVVNNEPIKSKLASHVKRVFQSISEGYTPARVEQAYVRSYERILSSLDDTRLKKVFARLRPFFTARAKALGIGSLAGDIGLTAFLAIQSGRNVGLRERSRLGLSVASEVNERNPQIATLIGSDKPLRHTFQTDVVRFAKKARVLGASASLVGLTAPFHRGAKEWAEAEGYIGEKVAHIINRITSGQISFKDIGRYKMNTIRVGEGKPT